VDKPSAYIFDIDGTLAKCGERGVFDFEKCDQDLLVESVALIIDRLRGPYSIVFLTGRSEQYRGKTEEWLMRHQISYDELIMRPDGDKTTDFLLKEKIYFERIEPKWRIMGVFEDRLRVCRMWHSIGLLVFRVGDPDADY
jgi:Straboviridae polynucleotide kinase